MEMTREKMLMEIMAVDFTLIDLNLYLDTHPYEQKTITHYNNCIQKAKILHENYEQMYGPLTPMSYSKCPWQWIESPWPWEKEAF